jgi:hypothetical protein
MGECWNMKKLDIRVIGKVEVDMNTLTDKAYSEVDKLFVEYSQLSDYKHYIWFNSELQVTDDGYWYHSNDNELAKVHNELDMIEYKILKAIHSPQNLRGFKGMSYRFLTHKLNPILDSKWWNLAFAGVFFYLYTNSCIDQNIWSAVCDGYLVQNNMLYFNIKSLGGK